MAYENIVELSRGEMSRIIDFHSLGAVLSFNGREAGAVGDCFYQSVSEMEHLLGKKGYAEVVLAIADAKSFDKVYTMSGGGEINVRVGDKISKSARELLDSNGAIRKELISCGLKRDYFGCREVNDYQ